MLKLLAIFLVLLPMLTNLDVEEYYMVNKEILQLL